MGSLGKGKYNKSVSFVVRSDHFRQWNEAMIADGQYCLDRIMRRIAHLARQNLINNKSVRTDTLRKAVRDKVVFRKGRAKKRTDGKVWGGVGIDRDAYYLDKKGKAHFAAKYAHLVEFGFSHYPDGKKINAKPFLEPAVNQYGGKVAISSKLDEIVRRSADGIKNNTEDFKLVQERQKAY